MKKTLIILGLWVVAIVLIAALVVSMGYSFPEAFFIGVQFLPGVFAARYFLSKISFKNKTAGIRDAIFVMFAILVAEIALVVLASIIIVHMRHIEIWWQYDDYPETLFNPVFIGMVLALLIIGDSTIARFLDRRFPATQKPIRFVSERKTVSLLPDEILYIESNDKEVTVYATDARRFRNKTGISQWENLLGDNFLRIHRSYLVNTAYAKLASPDTVTVNTAELSVSRKYKKAAQQTLSCHQNNLR